MAVRDTLFRVTSKRPEPKPEPEPKPRRVKDGAAKAPAPERPARKSRTLGSLRGRTAGPRPPDARPPEAPGPGPPSRRAARSCNGARSAPRWPGPR
ncbi:hypothetical protein GA0115240_14173 [Streptomyces sp. DvalAA-14]|nr:hypothetical protein GA0115240_14173 [Streptomyces sp. DvalAA-14]